MSINATKDDESLVSVSKRKTILRLFSYLLAYKKQIVIVLLLMLVCVIIGILNPLIMEAAIDKYIAVGDYNGLVKLIIFAVILNGIMIILIRVRMIMMAKLCNKILVTIRHQLYSHIQTLDVQYFDSRPLGKILSRIMGDINALKDVLSSSVTTLIPDFITICAVMIIMFVKNPLLAFAALLSTPLMALGVTIIEVVSHKRWQTNKKKASNLFAFIHENLAGIRVIQGFSAEKETRETFHKLVEEDRASFVNAVRINDAFSSVIDISWALGLISLYFFGVKVIGVDHITIGTFMAFSSYMSLFWNPIMNLSSFSTQLITNISGAERIFETLDTKPEIKDLENVIEIPAINGDVKFENVSFSYDDTVTVLNDVSFHIKPGETIALVGPTGAGKTTIVNLISRFYDVQSGNVLIDDYNVKDVSIVSLRSQMGIMTQDNYLFSGTISDNIRYGKLDATDEEIIAAAKAVNAHDFIMKLKDGYQTVLSERGGGLSIGQKQLLAFARTMVSMPKILILDEATSSIDTQTEILVQKGIENLLKGRTSFVIAHRLSTIKKADRIFVVADGQIKEEGSHSELLAQKGLYYKIYSAQFEEVMTSANPS